MVEFKIKIHQKERLAYIPKELVEILGYKTRATADRCAVLFYPEGANIPDVIKSLEIIKADLEHALQLIKKEDGNGS